MKCEKPPKRKILDLWAWLWETLTRYHISNCHVGTSVYGIIHCRKNIHGTALKFSVNQPQTLCIIHDVTSSEFAAPVSGRGSVIPVFFLGSLLDL